MDSSSHLAASTSLSGQAELYQDGSETLESPAFPSLTPLSHDLALLSPTHTPHFSVDDFLVSRTKASDLNFILSDLRSYSEKLKDELYSIINEDYKDFVSLGSSLKAEAHRIARLGWNARSTDHAAQDHIPQQGLMAPVRDTLLASRSMLKSVEQDIQDCIKRKEDATAQKAKLELMLQLHDSIVTLEDLLLVHHDKAKKERRRSSHATARRPSVLSITSTRDRRTSLASIASGSDQELSDYAMSSEYDDDTDSEDDASDDQLTAKRANGDASLKRTRRRILRRLSSGTHNPRSPVQTRDSAAPAGIPTSPLKSRSEAVTSTAASSSASSLLGLPQRIARTSAEYSRLRFLHRRIDEENLAHYADALQDRIDTVRSVLRQDLRTLLSYLVSPQSLLVHGQSSAEEPSSPELRKSVRPPTTTAAMHARRSSFVKSHARPINEEEGNELDAWSQVAEPVEQGGGVEAQYWRARLEEQRAWLEMALSTLNALTLLKRGESGEAGSVTRRNEAEEAVRDLLVSDWAARTIVANKEHHANGVSVQKSLERLPQSAQALFEEHHRHTDSVLISSTPPSTLLELYNTLLTFVATTAWHITDASREISHQSIPSSITPTTTTVQTPSDTHCDIFTNVVWDTLSSHLLTTMGNLIFFVGQPDTFYANYTLTTTFLQRFLSLAPSPQSRVAMQEHPNWLAFNRRWQLPVYFQMRFREVVTRLEAEFVDGTRKVKGEEGWMMATGAVVTAVERVWSEGVHIHELSAREWRVTLQLLSRYKTWVEEQSAEFATVAGGRQLDAMRTSSNTGADGGRTSIDRPASSDISRVSTPQPPPDSNAQQRDDEQLHFATALLSDCFVLRAKIESVLDEVVLARIGAHLEVDAEAGVAGMDALRADLVRVLDEESLDFIPGLTASVGRLVYNVLLPRVASPLRLLRSFSTPAYRPSSSSAPTGTAAGVTVIHQLFHPLETFLHLPTVRNLPSTVKRTWSEKILADAFKRYTSTIETINKNQQSLIRLKKSQTPSSTGGLLGGLFKSSSASSAASAGGAGETVAELERAFVETNRQALATFESKLNELELDIDLQGWTAWLTLKRFLESDLDQL
ncbi:hypothetical protein EX895_001157 [Sporisorium graminicola]|uniref:Conserved oligomeric Golgi complex subunit 2 n=1 Tax=Sporisorium graminicola TaxID=280036 RepID=A0A4U7KZ70_9BASI|nr:hypothetical protein EX895_001157 [Sporisorium graminicola]TKY89860.1 hypothetical protein EX895_001157 [Sporisorium graminicola]